MVRGQMRHGMDSLAVLVVVAHASLDLTLALEAQGQQDKEVLAATRLRLGQTFQVAAEAVRRLLVRMRQARKLVSAVPGQLPQSQGHPSPMRVVEAAGRIKPMQARAVRVEVVLVQHRIPPRQMERRIQVGAAAVVATLRLAERAGMADPAW